MNDAGYTGHFLKRDFFDRDAQLVAQDLLGKVIRVKHRAGWLAVRIIETEAYYLNEKGSHASLGFTEKRKALFMSPGTIYMYYARGGDSLNISCRGEGNAVLIKSAFPFEDKFTSPSMISIMQTLNPIKTTGEFRSLNKLCKGQTLVCRSLGLKVSEWDQRQFDRERFFMEDTGYKPSRIIQTTRLGISKGRDEHLPYRFIDHGQAAFCTRNPLTVRGWCEGEHYTILESA